MSHVLAHEAQPLVQATPDEVEPETRVAPIRAGTSADDILSSPAAFRHAMDLAATLARSQLLPAAFRGKPEDVFMAIMLARRMGEDVFTILSNVHFVNGKPGWAAPFLIARANGSGVFRDELAWETTGEGDELAVTCSGVLKKSGQRVAKVVSMRMARADGWTRNTKYTSIPEQMLSYRAATFLIRLYCPSILYGLHTTDEWEDVAASRRPQPVDYTDPDPPTPRRKESCAVPLASIDTEPEVHRVHWVAKLASLRASHSAAVSEVAKRLGLRTPKQCSTLQLQQLCEAVQEEILETQGRRAE